MMENETQYNAVISDKEEKVLENLVNITSFCPSVILSNAQKRRDLNQFSCDDLRANDFIKLDNKIYIDKDDKDVSKFGDAMFNWVDSLCDLIRYIHNDLNFTVIPGGSFPLNVKVENLNEFDYVLAWENTAELVTFQEFLERRVSLNIQKDSVLLNKVLNVIKVVLFKSEKNMNVSDIILLLKVHAINLQFSWSCSSKHKHSVSLDLAISTKTSSTIQEYFSQVGFPLKGTPFEESININEKIYWNSSFLDPFCDYWDISYDWDFPRPTYFGRIDANIFDKQMFKTCDEISLNIRMCYRVLKYVRDYIFPYCVGEGFSCLTGYWSNYEKKKFSSYSLKQVLFQEVIECPSNDYWKNSSIHVRIASMMQKLLIYPRDVFDNKNRKLSTLDEVSKVFSPVLTNMTQWLCDGCEAISLQQRSMLSECGEGIKVLLENKILISLPEFSLNAFEIEFFNYFQILMFKSFRPLVFYEGVPGGLYEAFNNILGSIDHVDLASFSDKDFEKLIFLLRFFIITKKEIDCSNYSKKLNSFKKMLMMYQITCSDACKHLKDLADHCSVSSEDVSLYEVVKEKMSSTFISLEEIFTSLTWEDRGYIYSCFSNSWLLEMCGDKRYMDMKQTLNRVEQKLKTMIHALKESWLSYIESQQMIWILVSISTLKNLK